MILSPTISLPPATSLPSVVKEYPAGYARVAVDEEAQRTRVAWGTDAPQWEEVAILALAFPPIYFIDKAIN